MAKSATTTTTTEVKPSVVGVSMNMPHVEAGVPKAALEAAAAGKGGSIHMIPLPGIKVIPGFNIRITDSTDYVENMQALARSIATEGFYNTKPVSGMIGKDEGADVVFLVDGHRRLEGTKMANVLRAAMTPPRDPIEAIPVILKPSGASMRDLTISLIKENTGEKPTPVEQAVVVKRLLKDKMDEKEVASALDMTERWVRDLIVLIQGPKSIREAAKSGAISGTEAIRILRKHSTDPKKAEEVVATMLAKAKPGKKATRKDTEEGTKGGTVANGVKYDKPVVIEWTSPKGATFKLAEVKGFAHMLPDTDWYSLIGAETGTATLTEAISFKAVIRREKKDVEPKPAPAKKTAPAKKGAGAGAKGKPAAAAKKPAGKAKPAAKAPDAKVDTDGL